MAAAAVPDMFYTQPIRKVHTPNIRVTRKIANMPMLLTLIKGFSKTLGLLNSWAFKLSRKSKLPHIFQLFNFTRGRVVETGGDKKSRRAIGVGGRDHPSLTPLWSHTNVVARN